jgi:hypothetical protein
VSEAVQAANLRTAFDAFRAAPYVGPAFWFQLRDIGMAGMYYGLLKPFDPPWERKPAWNMFHQFLIFLPIIVGVSGDAQS